MLLDFGGLLFDVAGNLSMFPLMCFTKGISKTPDPVQHFAKHVGYTLRVIKDCQKEDWPMYKKENKVKVEL